jgi:hypothetical protein
MTKNMQRLEDLQRDLVNIKWRIRAKMRKGARAWEEGQPQGSDSIYK